MNASYEIKKFYSSIASHASPKVSFPTQRIITFNFDNFGMDPFATKTIVDPDSPDVHIFHSDDPDLLYYRKAICSLCRSNNIVNYRTFIRALENGIPLWIQRFRCNDCHFSFEENHQIMDTEYTSRMTQKTKPSVDG